MNTLANRLGFTEHLSFFLRKARGLGLHSVSDLMSLAITRGCHHYRTEETTRVPPVSTAQFDDEELSVALLSPCLPYDPWSIRLGAQLLGGRGNRPQRLAFLARLERAQAVVRYVAEAGRQTEPGESFWHELLANLEPANPIGEPLRTGIMPHPSRFRSETIDQPA